jgi:hypothetical protein
MTVENNKLPRLDIKNGNKFYIKNYRTCSTYKFIKYVLKNAREQRKHPANVPTHFFTVSSSVSCQLMFEDMALKFEVALNG